MLVYLRSKQMQFCHKVSSKLLFTEEQSLWCNIDVSENFQEGVAANFRVLKMNEATLVLY